MAQLSFLTPQVGVFFIGLVLLAIPAGIVVRRTGHSAWWGLLCLVPILALVGLWVLAFVRWPRVPAA